VTSNRFFDRRIVAVAALIVASCSGGDVSRTAVPTVDAPTEIAAKSTLPETRITTGTVRSATIAPLAAKVMGNVTRVLVVEGQRVHAGDLLVEIDDREARAKSAQATGGVDEVDQSIAAARANAEVMAKTYARFSALRDRNSVSAQEFDEVAAKNSAAQAQLQQMLARRMQARAGIAEAETFLSYSRVRSPIDGIVTARMIDPGAQAAPGMPLLTVEDDAHYRVETSVDEELATRVRASDAVTIDGVAARVTNIVPAVDPTTRSALVKIDLPVRTSLRSGAFVHVAFTTGSRSGITVPATSIVRRGELASVFVVGNDGIARMRLVTIGEAQGGRVEVLSGLDDGERIVGRVTNEVQDGVRVS
jgi:RND family efflux transporter MFP subunit